METQEVGRANAGPQEGVGALGAVGAVAMGALATVALSGCGAGSQGFEAMTAERAARLLNQGGLGSTPSEVSEILDQGADTWFEAQKRMPIGPSIWQWAIDRGFASRAFARSDYGLDQALWWRLCTAQDVMRQRMVLALSEIFVVSPLNMVAYWRQFGCIAWWELLEQQCFGNFRDLLEGVADSKRFFESNAQFHELLAAASGRGRDQDHTLG